MMPTPVRGFLVTLEYTGGPDVDFRQLYHILGASTVGQVVVEVLLDEVGW